MEAALSDPAPPRALGQNGRPRQKGARRPTLPLVLSAPQTQGRTGRVNTWDGGGARAGEVCPDTAGWEQTGLPPVALRWVFMRDPQDECAPQARLAPHLADPPAQIWEGYEVKFL